MTWVDWVAVGIVAVAALGGASQGLAWSGLSFAGLVGGAFLGGQYVAPHILAREAHSPYAPLIALACAVGSAILFETVGSALGAAIGRRLRASPLGALDLIGGLLFGTVSGWR